jgi:hypothetical protein
MNTPQRFHQVVLVVVVDYAPRDFRRPQLRGKLLGYLVIGYDGDKE